MLPGVYNGSLSPTYDVVIVGAGIQGVALAYELAKRDIRKIAVLDRSWPGNGASGRNGEMIRSAFSSPEWISLFHHSLKRWHRLSAELDFNVLFNPSGYVVLASTEQQWQNCQNNVRIQADHGVYTELLDAAAMRELLPAANPDLVLGGILQPDAGFAHHDAVVWAYLNAAARMGVEVHAGIEVLDVCVTAGRVTGVTTSKGAVSAPVVVNAAGGGALEVNAMAGVDLPLVQSRLEMIVTEPLRPFLRLAVAPLELLGYCHQTARGEFVGGTELPYTDESGSLNGTYELLRDMATKWVRLFPVLSGARLLRHWAGTVTQYRDLAPVIGEMPGLPGYVLTIGWVYGFMGAPGAADLLAEAIVSGHIPPILAPFSPQRVLDGRLIAETSLVVPSEVA